MIAFIFSPIGKAIALAAAILAIVATIYMKGRSDAGKSLQIEQLQADQRAIERGIDAAADAARAAADDAARGVRNDEWDRK